MPNECVPKLHIFEFVFKFLRPCMNTQTQFLNPSSTKELAGSIAHVWWFHKSLYFRTHCNAAATRPSCRLFISNFKIKCIAHIYHIYQLAYLCSTSWNPLPTSLHFLRFLTNRINIQCFRHLLVWSRLWQRNKEALIACVGYIFDTDTATMKVYVKVRIFTRYVSDQCT